MKKIASSLICATLLSLNANAYIAGIDLGLINVDSIYKGTPFAFSSMTTFAAYAKNYADNDNHFAWDISGSFDSETIIDTVLQEVYVDNSNIRFMGGYGISLANDYAKISLNALAGIGYISASATEENKLFDTKATYEAGMYKFNLAATSYVNFATFNKFAISLDLVLNKYFGKTKDVNILKGRRTTVLEYELSTYYRFFGGNDRGFASFKYGSRDNFFSEKSNNSYFKIGVGWYF